MAGTVVVDTVKSSTTGAPVFQNTSGTAIGQLARAWAQFNGSTATVNGAFNVSSVTRVSTGYYNVNFTNNMPNVNYSTVGSQNNGQTITNYYFTPTVSQVNVVTGNVTFSGFQDATIVCISVFAA